MVREAKGKKKAKSKGNGKSKPKGKDALKPEKGISKEAKCFYCEKSGHWKRNYPLYLEEVKKAKANGASSSGASTICPSRMTKGMSRQRQRVLPSTSSAGMLSPLNANVTGIPSSQPTLFAASS
ncbi:hypothetical protein V6N12_009238 [Hibiscus sabdariffa]|uniref:Gag/pol protein n=1 Tax=Hibiscus sabdariffa TaxID=183260 RepID=A0ABR2BID2_9ROSI